MENDISFISYDYDMVYMFGIDKRLKDEIRIETCAKGNNEIVNTEFNIFYLQEKLKKGNIAYTVSNKPTCYLCNAAYYHMLKKNTNTVFIHIPSLSGITIEMMRKLIKVFKSINFV